MSAKDALELAALLIAVMGSVTAAIMSWAQMRGQIGHQSERITELQAKVKELDTSRMSHVERFMHIEGDIRSIHAVRRATSSTRVKPEED
jgi:hypothetical protein